MIPLVRLILHLLILFVLSASKMTSKRIVFLRHSTTENNEALSVQTWGSANFRDQGLFDTRLSTYGLDLVKQLNVDLCKEDQKLLADIDKIELIAVSPLRRCLQTATIGLDTVLLNNKEHLTKKEVCALARERLYMAADEGRPRSALQGEYGHLYDFSSLPENDESWWYQPDTNTSGDVIYKEWRPKGEYLAFGEPEQDFFDRMKALKQWLAAREESHILLVCHWGVIRALTGESVANCAFVERDLSELNSDAVIETMEV